MSINTELVLLSTMLHRGHFVPLAQGAISRTSFLTTDGQTIYDFIMNYKEGTGGSARYPSLSIVKNRFANTGIALPEPEPGAEIEALVYEVRLQALRASLRSASTALDALADSVDPIEGIGSVMKELRDGHQGLMRAQHLSIGEAIGTTLVDYATGNILPNGIPWPWPSLTRVTHGIQRKEFGIIAGRPKNRKTFLLLNVGVNAFLNYGARILVLTPEMAPRQIMLRVIADAARVRYGEFKDATLSQAEEMRLCDLAESFGQLDDEDEEAYGLRLHADLGLPEAQLPPSFNVLQSTNRTISWIQTQIQVYQPDIVLVDSLYRHQGDGAPKNSTETTRTAAVSRGLKELTMEENVAILATHQINREGNAKVGDLSNIALSDAIGQDLDVGFRAITGQLNGIDHTALVAIGAREIPFKGLLLRNIPSVDFSEVAVLEGMGVINQLLHQDNERADKDEQGKGGKKEANAAVAQRRTASIAAAVVANEEGKLAMRSTKKAAKPVIR